jgi:hypothetical protein
MDFLPMAFRMISTYSYPVLKTTGDAGSRVNRRARSKRGAHKQKISLLIDAKVIFRKSYLRFAKNIE